MGWTGLPLHARGPGECHRNQIDPHAGEWCVTLWRMDVNPLSPMRARRVEPQSEVGSGAARDRKTDCEREQNPDEEDDRAVLHLPTRIYGLPSVPSPN
jgi:hypothetical protein